MIDNSRIDTTATDRGHLKAALVSLGLYALTHRQWLWLPAISRILERKGLRDA